MVNVCQDSVPSRSLGRTLHNTHIDIKNNRFSLIAVFKRYGDMTKRIQKFVDMIYTSKLATSIRLLILDLKLMAE